MKYYKLYIKWDFYYIQALISDQKSAIYIFMLNDYGYSWVVYIIMVKLCNSIESAVKKANCY